MTNHPRRAGRRKHQRQDEQFAAALRALATAARRVPQAGWADLAEHVRSVRLGDGRPWTPTSITVPPDPMEA